MAKLEIWMGRANTGKSARVLERIRTLGDSGRQLLLVPEHASHQTEVDLCRACGPGASRHGEVLSLRLLANRVLSITGGLAEGTLDAGGKLLLMQRTLRELAGELTVYANPSRRAPFLMELVELCDEFQACHVPPERLAAAAPALPGTGGEKLRDLALICGVYQAKLRQDGADRRDLMTKLLEQLIPSGYARDKDVFLDGFAYFTAQEEQLIALLLREARSVTVTLLGERDSALEIFAQGIRTRDRLVRLASSCGAACEITYLPARPPETALEHLEAHFFGDPIPWAGDCSPVELYRADTAFSEAEAVAARILSLVRSGKYRFRDIAVAARNLDSCAATLENVFERYGIPIYLSRRSDILEKPVLSLLAGALDAVVGGYEYEDMFRFLKTGLAGLTDGECDILENYVIRWDIHGAMWVRAEDWTANPDGWREGFSEAQTAALETINGLRRRVAGPLGRLAEGLRREKTVGGKLRVLWTFLEEVHLPEQLEERTRALEELGELQRAGEYSQLWEVLCGVLDQFADTLGQLTMDGEEFTRLLKLVLTQYDVATIPVSLDQVQVSQITRNDRHRVKCLFLMGANDTVLPAVQPGGGLLTREDRARLRELADPLRIELAPNGLELFPVELQNLYAALSQPTDLLAVSWPAADVSGAPLRPSFVVERIRALLPEVAERVETGDLSYRLSAPVPALELAGEDRDGPLWQYFAGRPQYAQSLSAMARAAEMTRGRLSPQAVETLYGKSYRMSASRIDSVNSCHFAYFMQYGLRAKERGREGFDAAQVGTFLHYVLEHVVRDAGERGGFAALEAGELKTLIDGAIGQYMAAAMPGFDGRDARFKYLFRRLRGTVTTVVENVAEELRDSDFVPVAFELEFSPQGQLPAISITAGDASLTVSGKVDRVDGWLKDGRLYLRVVDYKTGRKAFDLGDICHGLNIQMLLYLFALEREGQAVFGHPVVPAGVMYLPARDVLVNAPRSTDAAKVRAELDRELRRSGLVLGQPEVLQAMEHSALDAPRFLPLTLGRDGSITRGIATAAELGKLGRYVDKLLERIARELRQGNIDADPCGRSENDSACTYCEFASACHFMEADDRDRMEVIRPVAPADFWAHVERTIGEEGER